MTRGAEPTFSQDPRAQWIKRELAKRGWQKKDLANALAEKSEGRLTFSGAYRLALRATDGSNLNQENASLIALVLGGPSPDELQERLAALVEDGHRLLEQLPALLAAAEDLRDAV